MLALRAPAFEMGAKGLNDIFVSSNFAHVMGETSDRLRSV